MATWIETKWCLMCHALCSKFHKCPYSAEGVTSE